MISVLGCTDQVIAHLLFLSSICCILSAVGLRETESHGKKVATSVCKNVFIYISEPFCASRTSRANTIFSSTHTHTQAQAQSHTSADLELCVFVDILSPLPIEDKLCLIGHSHDVVLHGMAQEPETNTQLLKNKNKKLAQGSFLGKNQHNSVGFHVIKISDRQ